MALLITTLAILAFQPQPDPARLADVAPTVAGFDAERLQRLDGAVDRAISTGQVPGAVVLVGRHHSIVYARAAGRRSVSPTSEAMTRDTLFDMASLTKPVATATSIMVLLEQGKIRLDDLIVKHLPELNNHGKGRITVEHLLRHRAGLVADNPLDDYQHGSEEAWRRISQLELVAEPGQRFLYSDVGFLILGRLIERVSGLSLDAFAAQKVFAVAGMTCAHFRPAGTSTRSDLIPPERIAPTEPVTPGGAMLRGIVHDPRARALGGTAGHAGLFATADDIAVFVSTLIGGGRAPSGRRLLSPLTVRAMFAPGTTPPGQRRGLGWDISTGYSSPRGSLFGPGSLGHTGFTGTSVWMDPPSGTFVIILTSRLHPEGKGASPSGLRSELATLAAAALVDVPGPSVSATDTELEVESSSRAPVVPMGRVKCGIDVLAEAEFAPLRGKRIGLVTNHTGRARDGRSTIDVLFKAPDARLVRLFSPEHGIRGELDSSVSDGKDDRTGLPIVSLYGARKKPEPKDLEGLDVLIYDIQDIGVRYYTYISTLGLVMEAAGESGLPMTVLDRPNPIGGIEVSGPVRDPGKASFIAYHPFPVRHGMTIGEVARLYKGERFPRVKLDVVECQGWSRGMYYDQIGLLWINPSPNMRSLTQALLYPAVGWLESTNLATGRGTDTPFERVGAPWIDPIRWSAELNSAGLPGVRILPIEFTPRERQHKGQRCGGVYIAISDRHAFEPMKLGVTLAVTLRKLYPREWDPSGILNMLAHEASYKAILGAQPVARIEQLWQGELGEFRRVRARYLIYR